MKTIRTNELQNVYAKRTIRMIQMGIASSKNSYTDECIYRFFGNKDWDCMDVSWTEFFIDKLNEDVDSINNGSIHWNGSTLFRFLSIEDSKFWESINTPMKTINDILYKMI